MELTLKKLATLAFGLLGLGAGAAALAAEESRGVVYAVHPQESTRSFIATYGPRKGGSAEGHFAVVKLSDGPYGDASYALVYVPPKLTVEVNRLVALDASSEDLLRNPGKGTVKKVLDR